MGAGASVDEQGGEAASGAGRPPTAVTSRPPSTAGSVRVTPVGSRAPSRRASVSSTATWRSAFRSGSINQVGLRKLRAAALGRKSAVTVTIDKTGFSLQHIRICEGQVVSFTWNDQESQGYNVTQVIHDGEQYRPVPGGFNSGAVCRRGGFQQQFNLKGEYKFVSAGIRVTPLTVEVFGLKDVEAELNDEGFAPKIIRIDEGSAVMWKWTGCSIPHTINEVRYNHKRGAMVQKEVAERPIPTKAGSFRKDFPKPGIFYFQTEGTSTGIMHTCIVHVRERQREYRVEILDRSFNSPIMVIEEGDRIWWTWNKEKCKKLHCVYQIEPAPLSHPVEESYKPLKNGFKWPQPSKCGLMSWEFYEPGVFYFSDHNFDEAAEYIGTIIVKPKQRDHFIEISAEGFTPDIVYAETGDRIWWTWASDDRTTPQFTLREIDKCLSPIASRVTIEEENIGEGSYMDDGLESMKVQVGLETVQLGSIGVYTYCLADTDQRSIASCSIVSAPGSRNHTVHVTDTGFEPKVVTIHPRDRVWWVWQDAKRQHNIIQVSHQGKHISGGFCSGSVSDCPSAFTNQFDLPGVYYYISNNLAKSFGAVVVSSQPQVHEVQLNSASITPDPVIVSTNDVVVWTFKGLRNYDVQQMSTVDKLLDIQMGSPALHHARRTLNRLFTEKGVYHFTSKSFLKSTKGEQRSDESRISSILVDESSDSVVVRVSSQGFQPKTTNITKGQSVLWTWKESGEEAHNIINVNPPESDSPLSIIQGGQSFNSGRPVARNSFLYTFDESGSYCVASQGAPGFAGSVKVLKGSTRTTTPFVSGRGSKTGGTVEKNYTIHLECETPGSSIFYTLDGSSPDLSRGAVKLYKPDKGICLRQSGLCVLRAIATSKSALNSDVMTSKRFWVLQGDEDNASISSGEPEQVPASDNGASWQWWQSAPVIKGCFTTPGVMEIFWEQPPKESLNLVKGYQVFLNGVTYCEVFPVQHNSVNIAGLAGGHLYEVVVEVYPRDTMYLPHKSNKLVMKCPKTTGTGGPLLSMERTEKPDVLAIVWMAISTPDSPIKGYRVYLNGQMCGSQVVPDENSDRCKVVIEGCNLESVYRIVVAAIPTDGRGQKMSNEIEVTLPLDSSHIRLPPAELRVDDDDLYQEYIEVTEGSGSVDTGDMRSLLNRGYVNQLGSLAQKPTIEPMTFDLKQNEVGFEGAEMTMMGNPVSSQADYGIDGYEQDYLVSSDTGGGYHGLADIEETSQNEEEEEDDGMEGGGETTDEIDAERYASISAGQAIGQAVQPLRSSTGSMGRMSPGPGSVGAQQMASVAAMPPGGLLPHPPTSSVNQMAGQYAGSHRTSMVEPPGDQAQQLPQTLTHVNQGHVMQYPPAMPTHTQHVTGLPPTGQQQRQQSQPRTQSVGETEQMPPVSPGDVIQKTKSVDQSRQYIEGVAYKAHKPGAAASGPDHALGMIDATQGPWTNKMKTVADATRVLKYIKPDCSDLQHLGRQPGEPPGGVEVEVQEDSPDETADSLSHQSGKKKRRRRRTSAVVEVQDSAHLRYEGGEQDSHKPEVTAAVSAVPVLGHQHGQDQFLPAPVVSADNRGTDSVRIRWTYERTAEPLYRLLVNVVNVVGKKFHTTVNSDISFECLQDDVDGTSTSAVQHCWNVTSGPHVDIQGLVPGTYYDIFVVANYALVNAKTPTELQAKSDPIRYRTLGPPPAPVLRPSASDLYQVTLAWESSPSHKDVAVVGYKILVDSKQLGTLLSVTTQKTTIDNLQPGTSINVNVVAVTEHPVGNSDPSNTVKVVCPARPPPPAISQQPSYKRGCVIVGWDKSNPGQAVPFGEDIIVYRIFVENSWHGEAKSNSTCNRNGYQYYLTDLSPGQSYDINVRSYAGQLKVDPQADKVFCISESVESNTVPVMCPAPPRSPCLRVEGMHADGIDITWEMPQQFGDAVMSGYQLMKDGKLYGSIMPPDVHSLRIKDVTLGERVELQILALTDHPVGRDLRKEVKDKDKEGDGDSGVGTATMATEDNKDASSTGYQDIYIGDRYSACRPGPKLVVLYTGLVMAPAKVWCERVTGHSAMIVWERAEKAKAHYIQAESFQVTWWTKDASDDDINSQATKDDHLLVTGLKPNVTYNVVVEARKMQAYSAIHEGDLPVDDGYGNLFILAGKSEQLTVKTARPPSAPTNLGITATTCSCIQVAWDPPVEVGVEVLGVRVDAVAMNSQAHQKHSAVEVTPDKTSATVENLHEKTEYLLTVTLVTEEYFEQLPEGSELRFKRALPETKAPPDDPWLPSSCMIAMTSGTDAPTDVKVTSTTVNSLTVTWAPPVVYGSNRLLGTVVRWADSKVQDDDDNSLAHHRSITADSNQALLEDLYPGILYRVVVEAVVSVKTVIDSDKHDPESEKRNRRTTHVLSAPCLVRTRAPCEAPCPLVTAYSTDSIQLYWERPLLYTVVGKDGNGNPKYLKMSLEGYRLEINGKPHMKLMSAAQSCTLVKCRPGKTYQIVLVALTCTDDVKRERKRRDKESFNSSYNNNNNNSSSVGTKEWDNSSNDEVNDESPSEPLVVSLPPERDDFLSDLNANFAAPSGGMSGETYSGDVHVEWGVQGTKNNIDQFTVTWHCSLDGSVQRKVVNSSTRICSIPVGNQKCVYDVTVEPEKNGDSIRTDCQKVQVVIPGSPDPPEIWMRSVYKDEFIIEWGEPRLYGVRVQGYQVYLNGKKVGNQLSSSHRKAVIPCKPKRCYKVNLVALSTDANYADSELSNTLMITPGSEGVRYIEGSPLNVTEQDLGPDDDGGIELPARVVKVTDTSVQLDWAPYNEVDGVAYYRVTWSSVAQPAEREVKLPSGEKSCVLHKCFPGTNHFLRVFAMGRDERILDVSRQLTVQTCAPPDTPVVTIRACNFRYIAIQWEKPTTYGDTLVTGYKVYVNGVVESIVGPDHSSFSFTQGHWCREYAFQVQALTASEKLNSKPSDALVVTWPGVQPPILRRVPAVSGNSIKVTWDTPATTDGIKIKMYKVLCVEEESQQTVQVISPIHPNTTEAELQNLKAGSYLIYAEVHVHGTNDIVKSEVLKITPTLTPDAPHIAVTVIGLEERRQVEKVTCDLINKRDRLINFLTNREVTQTLRATDENQLIGKVTEDLAHIEDMLDDCLASLSHYTGHLLAHVSWTCPQSNPDIKVTGYKVLVDGKQYGTTLHAGVQNVRVKLGLQQPSHRLSMVSVSDHPHTTSVQSNIVELLTDPFKPFSFFSYLDSTGPRTSGLYSQTLAQERKSRRPINQGLLKRHVPPPAAAVMDVFEGEYHPLFPPSGPRSTTALLFWAKWNPASRKALGWFVRFAKSNSAQNEFIAVACTAHDPTANDRQELVHVITENGWRDDKCVRHVTSHCASPSTIGSEYVKSRNGDVSNEPSSDVADLFGIVGVPMIVLVHPGDYIAWKGRYCAFDYISYENVLKYVFAQASGQGASPPDPWDTNIDVDALDGVSKRGLSESQMLIHRPTNNMRLGGGNTSTVHMNGNRPTSAKKPLFRKSSGKKSKDKLSISTRPFSASGAIRSPYATNVLAEEGLIAGPKRRAKSGKKLNGNY